ncbi:autotransporter assembly complex family protein [Roseococcus sp. DSY-14]|uniref:autotransporter assembly complex protein TamA n=1 Tax=Roseococcus sp. DSY-14 TaxID=3369650 RepID=UPI00387B2D36
MRILALAILLPLLALPARAQAPTAPPGPPTPPAQAEPAIRLYEVTVVPTGDGALDAAIAAATRLVLLQERAPTDLPGILARARGDLERLRAALDSEGYFAGAAEVRVAGQDPAAVRFVPPPDDGTPIPVTIRATPGPRYRITRVAAPGAEGRPEAAALQDLVGEPARGANVVSAQQQLIERLLASGHPFAAVSARDVLVDHDRQAMEITLDTAPGPFATFANSTVSGTQRVDPGFLRRFTDRRLADRPYDPARLSRARADVTALGVFDSVRLDTGEALDPDGRLPVQLTVTERLRRAIGVNAAYETRFGATLGGFFEHRNLFGQAERLRIEAAATRLGAREANRFGYRIGPTLRVPALFGGAYGFAGSLFLLRERQDQSFDRDAVTGSFLLERRLNDRLVISTGPVFEVGRSGPARGELVANQVLGWQVQARWDSTDSLLNPRRGFRVTGTATPSYTFREGNPYLLLRATASTYFDVSGDGRSIVAVRGGYGNLLGVQAQDVPFSQRFFAGGGGSVRGYDFQSISPRDPRTRAKVGGSSLAEASAEWRQRIGANWGAVGFVDAGRVGGAAGGDAAWRLGVGVGVRYYTALGPFRADVALPLVRQQGSQGYGLYLGLGHAF